MGFEEFWKDVKVEPETEKLRLKGICKAVWNAAINETIKATEDLIKSHIKDVDGECGEENDYCDFLVAWRTAANNIGKLK